MSAQRETLTKNERLNGRKDISELISKGKFGNVPGGMRYCHLQGTGSGLNRIMVSVPKKLFKRAVKRNLLKRRIRESYRHQKYNLETVGNDVLFMYSTSEILTYREIYSLVGQIIGKINKQNGHKES